MKELYMQSLFDNDPFWIVKMYFNRMYGRGVLVKVVNYLLNGIGYGTDGGHCAFREIDSYFEEDHFEVLKFISGIPTDDKKIIISKEEFNKILRETIDLYLKNTSGG